MSSMSSMPTAMMRLSRSTSSPWAMNSGFRYSGYVRMGLVGWMMCGARDWGFRFFSGDWRDRGLLLRKRRSY